MPIERRIVQVAEAVQGALDRRGCSIDSLTHAQQLGLADRMGVHLVDLNNALDELESRRSRGGRKGRRVGTTQTAPPREPDVVGNMGDRLEEDRHLRSPGSVGTLSAIDVISRQMGLDVSKSPSLRRAYIDLRVSALYARGRVPDGTKDADEAWTLYRRYKRILDRGRKVDLDRSQRSEVARTSLRRQVNAAKS